MEWGNFTPPLRFSFIYPYSLILHTWNFLTFEIIYLGTYPENFRKKIYSGTYIFKPFLKKCFRIAYFSMIRNWVNDKLSHSQIGTKSAISKKVYFLKFTDVLWNLTWFSALLPIVMLLGPLLRILDRCMKFLKY